MISFSAIVDYIQSQASHLHQAVTGQLQRVQTFWLKMEVIHALRQFMHLLILLVLLGLALAYLVPAGP